MVKILWFWISKLSLKWSPLFYVLFLCSVQHLASKKKGQGTTTSVLTIATQLRVSVLCDVKWSDAFIYRRIFADVIANDLINIQLNS